MSVNIPFQFKNNYYANTHSFYTVGDAVNTLPITNIISLTSNQTMIFHNNNIGIGTNIPRAALDINGNAIIDANVGIGTRIITQTVNMLNRDFYIFGGNLGVGTTIPTNNLDVYGNISVKGNIGFSNKNISLLEITNLDTNLLPGNLIRRTATTNICEYIQLQGFKYLGIQSFSNVGTTTYYPTSSAQVILIGCLGGGGGGSGCESNDLAARYAAGGSGGGFASYLFTGPMESIYGTTITVGDGGAGGVGGTNNTYIAGAAGGSSSFGTIVSATGGPGGAAAVSTTYQGDVGIGSIDAFISSFGEIQIRNSSSAASGQGGSSVFAAGPAGRSTAGAGTAATANTGTGGAGAMSDTTTGRTGGKGGSGLVFVIEFGLGET
jgi:hypothetical protein